MDWLHLPADEASLPTDEASPIDSYIFFLFFSSCECFFLSATGVLPSKSAVKTLFLRTYFDLLNYPFNSYLKKKVLMKHCLLCSQPMAKGPIE